MSDNRTNNATIGGRPRIVLPNENTYSGGTATDGGSLVEADETNKRTKCSAVGRNRILRRMLLMLITLPYALADENEKISLQDILTHKSIRIGDLKKLNLVVKQGHGPVMWSTVDAKREVWFWYKPGIKAALGMGEIVLIANVIPNDENNGTIIWPKDKVGHDYGKELDALYNDK